MMEKKVIFIILFKLNLRFTTKKFKKKKTSFLKEPKIP